MDSNQIYRFLKTLSPLGQWSDTELQDLAGRIEAVQVRQGESVFDSDYQADDAYIVHVGQVRQSVRNEEGDEWWYRTHTKGQFFAQQALFRGKEHASSAIAETDTTLLRIGAPILAEMLNKHPELWRFFQNNTAARLQAIPLLRNLDDSDIERLAVSTEVKEFGPGETICRADEADGMLWIIDWGQVQIGEQAEVEMAGGRQIAVSPTPAVLANQGFSEDERVLTAGNYFVGGLVAIPSQLTVTAVAKTKAKLLRIPGSLLELSEQRMPDIQFLLRHRLRIARRLQEAMGQGDLFKELTAEHWRDLATVTAWEHVPAGLDVTQQGQMGTKIHVLAAGAALVRSTDPSGRERPRHVIRKGFSDYYGIAGFLRRERHDATVRSLRDQDDRGAVVDGSDWLTLQRDDVVYLLAANPQLWQDTVLQQQLLEKPADARFAWQEKEETIEFFSRRHSVWLWGRVGVLFLVTYGILGLIALVGRFLTDNGFRWQTYFLVWAVLLFPLLTWFVIDYLNDYYVITNRRVMRHDRVLFIYENRLEAMIERIQDITVRTTLMAKILNYGNLAVQTAATGGAIIFDMVPDPEYVENILRSMQSQVRAGQRAEERENLRDKLLSGLKMRLIPEMPGRVLPADIQPQRQMGPLQRFWSRLTAPFRTFFRWLRELPEKIYVVLLKVLPKRAQDRILKERRERARRRAAQMQDKIIYRKHIFFLIRAAIVPIATLIITIGLFLFTNFEIIVAAWPSWIRIPMFGFIIFCAFWLWYRWENWRNDQYILTRSHVIDITALPLGLFEQRRQAEWSRVQNANYEIPNFWANLFNYGTVIVETAATFGQLDFVNVPNPRKVQQEIFLRMTEARQAAEAKETAKRQATLSETLEIYNELIQEWASRAQATGNPPPPQAPPQP
jgi:CRP-like cAMP-binding protein/uncharacterized membrane protein YdbT with pleckstrin-like domain